MINTSSFRSGGIRFLFIPRELDPINSGPKINTEVRKQDRGLRINIRCLRAVRFRKDRGKRPTKIENDRSKIKA